jgi:hypothetical protein
MVLHDLLAPRRDAVVGAWLTDMLATWPSPASTFVAAERDPFRNPIGRVMREALDAAFVSLVSPAPLLALPPAFAELVALCAVQQDGAADFLDRVQGMAAIAGLVLESSAPPGERDAVMRTIEERVPALAQLASAEHARCRERIAAIRAHEAASRTWTAGGRRLHRPGAEAPGATSPSAK